MVTEVKFAEWSRLAHIELDLCCALHYNFFANFLCFQQVLGRTACRVRSSHDTTDVPSFLADYNIPQISPLATFQFFQESNPNNMSRNSKTIYIYILLFIIVSTREKVYLKPQTFLLIMWIFLIYILFSTLKLLYVFRVLCPSSGEHVYSNIIHKN